jgi:BirA family biotin operon repressor/biotin-[acetyl-CoA-carboxylase] ligase
VGVGINVNNTVPLATSLREHDGLSRDLTDVLLAVLDEFDRRWRELLSGRFQTIAADYRRRCLLTNKSVRIEQAGGHVVQGRCRGIDHDGLLLVQTDQGEKKVVAGTVSNWE